MFHSFKRDAELLNFVRYNPYVSESSSIIIFVVKKVKLWRDCVDAHARLSLCYSDVPQALLFK